MMRLRLFSLLVATAATATTGCSGKEADVPKDAAKLTVTSSDFTTGTAIPVVHTCKGEDRSPALAWSGVPESARSIALVCDDPDAPMGTWVHWVAYGIPPSVTALPAGVAPAESIPGGGLQGKNSWKKLGYGGPCPPSGTHRYFFKVYALDAELSLPAGATKDQLVAAMAGHIVGHGELMGTFTKS